QFGRFECRRRNISIGKWFMIGYPGYMSKQFRTCSLDQPLLLPPSLQDWLPEKHLARFIADVTEQLDLSEILVDYADRKRLGQLFLNSSARRHRDSLHRSGAGLRNQFRSRRKCRVAPQFYA